MKVCTKCKIEMVCSKTGFTARFGSGYCFRGDKHKCPECGIEVGVMNPASYHSEAPLTDGDIQMFEPRNIDIEELRKL